MDKLYDLHISSKVCFGGKGNTSLLEGIGNLKNLEILDY